MKWFAKLLGGISGKSLGYAKTVHRRASYWLGNRLLLSFFIWFTALLALCAPLVASLFGFTFNMNLVLQYLAGVFGFYVFVIFFMSKAVYVWLARNHVTTTAISTAVILAVLAGLAVAAIETEKKVILAIIVAILNAVPTVVAIFAERSEKREKVVQSFESWFSRYETAKDVEGVGRDQLSAVQIEIENLLTHSRMGLSVINLHSHGLQGRTLFLQHVGKTTAERFSDGYNLNMFNLRDVKVQETQWPEFLKSVKDYSEQIMRTNHFMFLLMDDLFNRLSPEVKKRFEISHMDALCLRLRAGLSNKVKTIIVMSSETKDVQSQFSLSPYLEGQDEEDEGVEEDYGEVAAVVRHMRLKLTRKDANNILAWYAQSKGYDAKTADTFLAQPGMMGACRGDLAFLLYLFERKQCPDDQTNPMFFCSRAFGNDSQRLRIAQDMSTIYEKLSDGDESKHCIQFIAVVNLLGLSVPNDLLQWWFRKDSNMMVYNVVTEKFLSNFPSSNAPYGGWRVKEPFWSYILLESEMATTPDPLTGLQQLLEPALAHLREWPYNQRDWRFLRNLIHFIGEDKHRPIIRAPGEKVSRRVFHTFQKDIEEYLKGLVSQIEQPDKLRDIREWASTLRRMGEYRIAQNLYSQAYAAINERPQALNVTSRARLLVSIAKGMMQSNSSDQKNTGIEICHSLLFDEKFAEVKRLNRIHILTNAVGVLQEQQPQQALEWTDRYEKQHPQWSEDALFCVVKAMTLEKVGGRLDEAERCYQRAEHLCRKDGSLDPKTRISILLRYSLFLTRFVRQLAGARQSPDRENLLKESEQIALDFNQSVEAVYQAWGEYCMTKTPPDPESALRYYRKAIKYCDDNGIGNGRPYNRIANFIVENVSLLTNFEKAETLYQEAEGYLHSVMNGEAFDWRSKMNSAHILGRLVGGTIKIETKKLVHYEYNGEKRPNFDEALQILENSFESQDHNARISNELKTWQDIQTHVAIKNVLLEKLVTIRRSAPAQEISGITQSIHAHYRQSFEGLPREDLDGIRVRQHLLATMSNYAGYCIRERQTTRSQREAAYGYWDRTIELMGKWGLNANIYFDLAATIYDHYSQQLFADNDLIPKYGVIPNQFQSNMDTLELIVSLCKDGLKALGDVNDRDREQIRLGQTLAMRAFMSARTLVQRHLWKKQTEQASRWVGEACDAACQASRYREKQILTYLNDFLNNQLLKKFCHKMPELSKTLEETKRYVEAAIGQKP